MVSNIFRFVCYYLLLFNIFVRCFAEFPSIEQQAGLDFPEDVCSPAGVLKEELVENVEKFQENLERELHNKIQQFTDQLKQEMKHQLKCLQKEQTHSDKTNEMCGSEHLRLTSDKKTAPVCDSNWCTDLATRMLHMIDHSADPCNDFYQYACGRTENNIFLLPIDPQEEADKRIKETIENLDIDNPVMGHAKVFHDACVQWRKQVNLKEAKSFAREAVRKLGWFQPKAIPKIDSNALKDMKIPPISNLTYILTKFAKQGFFPLFEVSIELDGSTPHRFLPRISLPLGDFSLSIDKSHIACNDLFRKRMRERNHSSIIDLNKEYEQYIHCKDAGFGRKVSLDRMAKAVTEMGLLDHIEDGSIQEKLLQDTKIKTEFLLSDMNFQAKIRNLTTQMLLKNYQINTVEDLDIKNLLGNAVRWSELLSALTGFKVASTQRVHIYHQVELLDKLTILESEWRAEPEATFNAMLMLYAERIFSTYIDPLGSSEEYCLLSTKYLLPDVSSAMYIHSYPDAILSRLQRQVNSFSSDIKKELVSSIEEDASATLDLKEKIQNISFNVGASQDETELDESVLKSMKEVKLNSSHFHNVDNLLLRRFELQFSLINEEASSPAAMWMQDILPFHAHATYNYELNKIYLPYGSFVPPLYYSQQRSIPDYINYGGLGNLIAKELMRSIDSTGMKFTGRTKTLLNIPKVFVFVSECLGEQTSYEFQLRHEELIGKLKLQTHLKLNDLLSSSGALRLAWEAYQHQTKDELTSTASSENHLIWLGSSPLEPNRAYFIRVAQTQCSASSNFNLLELLESDQLPPSLRVNLMVRNEPNFSKAFNCSYGKPMRAESACPFYVHRE